MDRRTQSFYAIGRRFLEKHNAAKHSGMVACEHDANCILEACVNMLAMAWNKRRKDPVPEQMEFTSLLVVEGKPGDQIQLRAGKEGFSKASFRTQSFDDQEEK